MRPVGELIVMLMCGVVVPVVVTVVSGAVAASRSSIVTSSTDPDFPSFQQLTGYPVLGKSYSTTVLVRTQNFSTWMKLSVSSGFTSTSTPDLLRPERST